ncbi:hypothetical protein PDIG_42040 [Penicillium digitatum PHI26]|uniref:Uncharacterized protein n=2 Tax=Penicillium digitatum TaxID=36651 RepID=K9GD76_PEND2|nr:hypothetical protein PDIG_42040 [Penicillium digitatum PHI26]
MALETSSPSHQGLTPPDSPMKGSATPQATVEDLKHLFDVLEKVLFDLTNRDPPNTPVFQDHSPPGPDMVQLKQLLEKVIRKGYSSAEPSQSCFFSNEKAEKVQAADGLDLESPICTTPDGFKSFEKWASKSQFKTVVETNDLDDYAEYAFVVRERVDRTSEEVVPVIDIKSEGLRDILRDVLHDIKAVSLMEDKPSVIETVLSSRSTLTWISIEQNFLFISS